VSTPSHLKTPAGYTLPVPPLRLYGAFVVNFLFPVTSVMSPVILLSSNEVMPIIRSLTGLRRLFPQPRYKIRCRFLNIF